MISLYYLAVIESFITMVLFIMISDKKVLFYNASFFIFVFIGNLGYLFTGLSQNVEEALVANKIVYLCGVILALFLIMLVSDACKITLNKYVRVGLYAYSCLVMGVAMTAGYTPWFYKSVTIEKIDGVTMLVKEYGPAHILFLIMLYGYFLIGILMLIYSIIKRKKLIYSNVLMMVFVYFLTIFFYTVGRKLLYPLDPIGLSYSIDTIVMLIITYNTGLYNLDEALLASVEKQNQYGYLLFDKKYRYVGCNQVAEQFIPDIATHPLVKRLETGNNTILTKINQMIENYNGENTRETISTSDQDIEIIVQYMYKNNKQRGYIVQLVDDSKRQDLIRQLDMISRNKSNFLSNVSHEIRTPINSVLGMNEMILRESQDDTIREYASNIASSGQTLLQLINDVLDLSKIESGKLEVLPVEYELADIIRELEMMIRPLIKTDDLTLDIVTDVSLPKRLYGDAIRVKQMVTNILTNAVKYTGKGHITFSVTGERKGDEYVFYYAVKDTGRGIREEDIENLFNAFERVDQRKNSNIEGTGLGLAITKKFAVMMGGDITVESEYGKGSTFTITVPQKIVGNEQMGDYKNNQTAPAREQYKESFQAPDARILVVDDVQMNLTVIKHLLKATQMQVDCCSSGAECIEAVKASHYDMILLDHMMPEMDGVDTLKMLRENHYCDDSIIIALTANVDVTAEHRYLELGFDGYLSKPVSPVLLEEMIRSKLGISSAE